jgi:hypothetical protein
MMREREQIEREIDEKRDDLVQGIQELKEVVHDKVEHLKDRVNVPKRARRAAVQAVDRVVVAAGEVRDAARARPGVFVAIGAGAVAAGVGVVVVRRAVRRRRSRGLFH